MSERDDNDNGERSGHHSAPLDFDSRFSEGEFDSPFEVGSFSLDPAKAELSWSDLFAGTSTVTSIEAFQSRVHADDRITLAQAIADSDKCGFDISFRLSAPDAAWRWIRARAIGIGEDGTRRLRGVYSDIGKEKQIEEALRQRESHLRSILQSIPDAMIVTDGNGIIQLFSAAAERLFGYPGHEAIGRNISMLMPEPDRSRHSCYIARYQTTRHPHIIGTGRMVNGQRRDGTVFPMHLSIGETNSGPDCCFTGFVRDLTEHQQTQARLQALQADLVHVSRLTAMGEMASALAHELNQPLAAISNYMKGSRRLLADSDDPTITRIAHAMDRASEQALRAGQIIRRLRDFVARGESERRVESLSLLIEEAGVLGLAGAREQNVQIQFKLDPEADLALVDRVQSEQVLVNLFRNALDAMENTPRRELTVTTARLGTDSIIIRVCDSGVGFQDDVLTCLFQTFFTTKETGMGIGLSISRSIIEAHGGRMWAENTPSGGATFVFTLPAVVDS